VIGDVKAQVAACTIGAASFQALFRRYGRATLREAFAAIHDYAERVARAAFAEIPDGTYRFENHIDGLGEDGAPIPFRVALTVAGSDVTVDWTGTSPQVKAGINAPVPFTKAAVYTALRSILGADVPNCVGFTRPIRIVAPLGTIANPRPPAACGARGITGFRMIDCLFGALAQAVPDRVAADGQGGATLPSIGGWHDGQPFVFVETIMGSWGATSQHDGQEGVAHMGANQSNVPVEMIEQDYPLRVEQYAMVPDSGGPGRFRGGLGMVREFRLLADEATLTVRSDKRRFPPFGLAGGAPGSRSSNLINPGPGETMLPVLTMQPANLRRGDVFRHVLSGGGGHGDPFARDPAKVLEDVVLGRVTPGHARAAYGVAVVADGDGWRLDAAATAQLRGGR
jgi:N-methylhydantoinase B